MRCQAEFQHPCVKSHLFTKLQPDCDFVIKTTLFESLGPDRGDLLSHG